MLTHCHFLRILQKMRLNLAGFARIFARVCAVQNIAANMFMRHMYVRQVYVRYKYSRSTCIRDMYLCFTHSYESHEVKTYRGGCAPSVCAQFVRFADICAA